MKKPPTTFQCPPSLFFLFFSLHRCLLFVLHSHLRRRRHSRSAAVDLFSPLHRQPLLLHHRTLSLTHYRCPPSPNLASSPPWPDRSHPPPLFPSSSFFFLRCCPQSPSSSFIVDGHLPVSLPSLFSLHQHHPPPLPLLSSSRSHRRCSRRPPRCSLFSVAAVASLSSAASQLLSRRRSLPPPLFSLSSPVSTIGLLPFPPSPVAMADRRPLPFFADTHSRCHRRRFSPPPPPGKPHRHPFLLFLLLCVFSPSVTVIQMPSASPSPTSNATTLASVAASLFSSTVAFFLLEKVKKEKRKMPAGETLVDVLSAE